MVLGLFFIEPASFDGAFDIRAGGFGEAVLLLMFAFGGPHHVFHPDRIFLLSRQERRSYRDVLDIPTRELELSRYKAQIDGII